jgi:MCP family monocarboxylic acid transporter-like MFS transporter 10
MICSFLCNGIIFGLINSYGVIYVALKNEFDEEGIENSEMKASFVGSLLVGSTFVLSPISGVLADCFGIRNTAFLGGFIATLGVFLSSFCIHNVRTFNESIFDKVGGNLIILTAFLSN